MTDARVAQMAEVIIRYSLNIQPGDKLAIRGNSLAEPLIKEAYRAAVRAGAHVVTQITLPGLQKIALEESNDKQLAWVNPFSQIVTEEFDALLAIQSEFNTREATGFDSEKLSKLSETNQPLQTRFFERAGAGELKWCATLFPTTAHAQDADMALEDYEDFVFSACLPDRENPIGFWQKMEDRQNRLIEFLDSINEIRLVAPDTDLTVNVGGRKWINCAGHENFPDGEVFTGPIENKTNGHVRFSYPAVHRGNEVSNVQFWFEQGRIVKATADKGEAYLHEMLDRDDGARVLGEFAIGTNPGIQTFTRNTLFDEKIQGTVHMAVGMSYPESGGVNESQIHWDMVCDMREGGQLFADGKLIYKNGAFVIDFE